MNQLFLTTKMNLFPKLWKQFGSVSSKSETENKTVKANHFSFIETDEEEEYGLRWDEYGNPYPYNTPKTHFL